MSAPLSKNQKRYLSQLSDRAWNRQWALALGRGEEWPEDTTAIRTAFRHAEVAKAVQKQGLRCCSQLDYKAVEAHFLHLLGEDGKAMAAHVRSQSEPKRQAEAVLWRELKAAEPLGITRGYIESICRAKFKCSLIELDDPGKLWVLVYDVRRSAAARRRRVA